MVEQKPPTVGCSSLVFLAVVALLTASTAVASAPGPWLCALSLYLTLTVLILDAGAGVPLYFPLFRPFLKGFQPRGDYARLKAKYG